MDENTKKKFEETLAKIVGEQVELKMKGVSEDLTTKMADLQKAIPMTIHSTKGIVDDGSLQQVGDSLYRLPQGAVVNTGYFNINEKGLRRRGSGMFEKASEPMIEFAEKVRQAVRSGQAIKFMEKEPDEGTIVTKDSPDLSVSMRSADDSSAGLFVPEDIRYAMLQFAPPGTVVWPRAQVWPMVTDKIQWPKLEQDLTEGSENFFGNVELRWTEEGGAKQTTRPDFKMITLECHEISASSPITDQLLADAAINIGNLLVQLFQGAYWYGTDKAFISGLGGSQPLGLLNTPGVNTCNRIVTSKVGWRDLINMHSKLPAMFDANAVWMMKKEVFNCLRKEVDDNGRPVIDVGYGYNNFGEGIAGYAAGIPIVMSDYRTSALGTTGDVILGDWKHYFIGERKTISVEMSRHVYFLNNMTAFRASARVGGIVEQEKAFVVLQSTADPNMS
jgi:HK97 family phage major capsid protein